jgi:hypothetical protein
MVLIALGGLGILSWAVLDKESGGSSLLMLVDIATALSVLTAPVLAGLNLMVLRGQEVPVDVRPGGAFLAYHVVGVVVLGVLAVLYVVARMVL